MKLLYRPQYIAIIRTLELLCLGAIVTLLFLGYRRDGDVLDAIERRLSDAEAAIETRQDSGESIETTFYGRSDAAHVVRTYRRAGEPVLEWLNRHRVNLENAERGLK